LLGTVTVELLSYAWLGKTPETGFLLDNRSGTLVRPALASLLICNPATLARLVCSAEPVVRHFVDQLIIPAPPKSLPNLITAFGGRALVPKSWRTLITRLVASREPGQQRHVALSRAASSVLAEYAQEIDRLQFERAGIHAQTDHRNSFPIALAFASRAEDWPQWRGSDRDGVWHETGIQKKFPAEGLPVRWLAPVGYGFSSA